MKQSEDSKPPKKPYKPPVMEVYGNIQQMTRNIANGSGMNDAGSTSKTKTGV